MLTDIHDFKNRVSFPHSNRTGLAEAQLFGLLAGLDATVPYYIKTCTPTTTQENGDWNWTFLVDYTSTDAAEIAGRAQTAEQSAAFLARQLFHASMPDYVRFWLLPFIMKMTLQPIPTATTPMAPSSAAQPAARAFPRH